MTNSAVWSVRLVVYPFHPGRVASAHHGPADSAAAARPVRQTHTAGRWLSRRQKRAAARETGAVVPGLQPGPHGRVLVTATFAANPATGQLLATPACLLATQNWGGSQRISTPNALRATAPTPPAGSTPARRPTAANATSPSTVTGWCWRSWSPSRRSRTATRRSGCSPHCAPRSPPSPWYGPIETTPGAS